MSYTPPIGSSTDFQFTGAAYVAPGGGGIAFEFTQAVSGEVSAQVSLSASVTAEHCIVSSVSARVVSLSVLGYLPVDGVVSKKVSFTGVVICEIAPNSRVVKPVLVSAAAHGSASATGRVSRKIVISTSALGATGCRTEVYRRGIVNSAVRGNRGAYAAVLAPVKLGASSRSVTGASGATDGRVSIQCFVESRFLPKTIAGVFGTVPVGGFVYGEVHNQYDTIDTVTVLTSHDHMAVFTDV